MNTETHFTIESGIPLAARRQGQKYPFDRLGVGDSFFVAGDKTKRTSVRVLLGRQIKIGEHPDRKFATRTVTEDGIEGIRIWRLA